MDCIDDYKWYFCGENIPYFKYRIYRILFGIALLSLVVVTSPYVGTGSLQLIDLIYNYNITDSICSLQRNPSKVGVCYLIGITFYITIITCSMVILGFSFLIGWTIFTIIKSVITDGCITHWTNFKISYLIGVIVTTLIAIYFISSYYITPLIFSNFTGENYFLTLVYVFLMIIFGLIFIGLGVLGVCYLDNIIRSRRESEPLLV